MSAIDPARAKKLGELIQQARLHARRSASDCGQLLGLAPDDFEATEAGERDLTLPEIEALAIYLDVSMDYFWGKATLPEPPQVDFQSYLELRQRIVGAVLQQMRIQTRQSTEELAEAIGVAPEVIETYESGETAVPYLHLEQLCRLMDGSVDDFVDDDHGPLSRHEVWQQAQRHLDELSPEMRAFVASPRNVRYLETAKKLSEMDVQKLRQVAENILDITF